MTKKSDIKVNLFNGNNANAPFVKVEYLDKDANAHAALMMIDSCSDVSILFQSMMDGLCCRRIENGPRRVINGLGGDAQEVKDVEMNFTLGVLECQEPFSICDVDYPQQFEYPVIGLLGNQFMAKHNLALDYNDFSVHTSKVSHANMSSDDCEYFFPMDLGYKYYHIPIIFMKLNGKEIVALADSGASNNMVAIQSLADSHIPFHFLGNGDNIVGMNGDVETQMGEIPFSLVTASGDGEKELKRTARFMISPDYIWSQKDKSDDEKDQIPPIEAILSSSFMANEGWVLDFGAQIIYKKKSCFLLDVNECATKVNDACHLRFFMDATKIGMPLIQITEGDFKGMVLLIDSGSSDNVIFEKAYREMRDKFERKDEVSRLMGMEGNPVEARIVKTRINICGKDYSMQFLVNNNN